MHTVSRLVISAALVALLPLAACRCTAAQDRAAAAVVGSLGADCGALNAIPAPAGQIAFIACGAIDPLIVAALDAAAASTPVSDAGASHARAARGDASQTCALPITHGGKVVAMACSPEARATGQAAVDAVR